MAKQGLKATSEFIHDGERYEITRFDGDKGLEIVLALQNLMMATNSTTDNLGNMITGGFSVPTTKKLIIDLLSVVLTPSGKPFNVVTDLIGNYSILIPLVLEVIKHNGFLEIMNGLDGIKEKLEAMGLKQIQSN